MYAGIDRNTAERFRKGERAFDGTLDLHGMTREKARAALHVFILGHYERGSRCLLVITGKGARNATSAGADPYAERGVLKRQVPHWLESAELRPFVVGFESATVGHGGAGALYVRVRKQR